MANLSVERYDNDSVVIRRADSTGSCLTAVYTGTRHGDRVGGEFTSSWPGHWDDKSGNWYATVEKSPTGPPRVMHFCARNCFTLMWDSGAMLLRVNQEHMDGGELDARISRLTPRRLEWIWWSLQRPDLEGR